MLISFFSYNISNIENKRITQSYNVKPIGKILKNIKIIQRRTISKGIKKDMELFLQLIKSNIG